MNSVASCGLINRPAELHPKCSVHRQGGLQRRACKIAVALCDFVPGLYLNVTKVLQLSVGILQGRGRNDGFPLLPYANYNAARHHGHRGENIFVKIGAAYVDVVLCYVELSCVVLCCVVPGILVLPRQSHRHMR